MAYALLFRYTTVMNSRPFDRRNNPEFGIPSAFSTSEVLTHLTRPQELRDLPATVSLERQLGRVVAYVEGRQPPFNPIDASVAIAKQFLDVSTNNRISQQPMFGPRSHERSESLAELEELLPIVKERGKKAYEYLHENVLPGRKATLDSWVDGWMYLTQGDPGKTEYRIYLAPKLAFAAGIFTEIAKMIPASVAYQMKMLSPDLDYTGDFARGDKIVLYPTQETLSILLKAVEDVYKRHESVFEGQLPPGGGVYCPAEGISVTYDPPREGGTKSTGTMEIAKVLDKALKEQSQDQLMRIVQKSFKDLKQFKASVVGAMMWKSLVYEGKWINNEWVDKPRVGRWSLKADVKRYEGAPVTEDDATLSKCYYEALYEEWILSLRDGRALNQDRVKEDFRARMKEEIVLSHAWDRQVSEKDGIQNTVVWPGGTPRIEDATRVASLAASVYKRRQKGEGVEGTLRASLRGRSYKPRPRED